MEIDTKLLREIALHRPDIILDAIGEMHNYRTCEDIIIEQWKEWVEMQPPLRSKNEISNNSSK